jgi:hypothetical protein
MSDEIQRVNYYDRELLRGFDFTADQTYHIEMRRRMNLALHLRGIACGLELMAVADTGDQYCVNPGIAIDGYGREIVLFDRYVLSDDDFRAAKIRSNDTYAVCISYGRQLATPPSAGYNTCGIPGQYTRWVESPTVQLVKGMPVLPDPPLPTDPLSDDPDASPWPVFLGLINLTVAADGTVSATPPPGGTPPATSAITTAAGRREYVGVRAQRIDAPAAIPPAPASGPPPDPTIYIDSGLPVVVEANLQAEQNLLVGTDFAVDQPKVLNPPSDPNFLNATATGYAKVANYLFVQGNIYTAVPAGTNPSAPGGGQWVSLADFVSTTVPEIQVTNGLYLDVTGPQPPNFSVAAKKLTSVSKADILVALAGIDWLNYASFNKWYVGLTTANPTDDIMLKVLGQYVGPTAGTKNSCDFSLSWAVTPSVTLSPPPPPPPPPALNVKGLTINYMIVFYP